jgi:WD40 repeat protein
MLSLRDLAKDKKTQVATVEGATTHNYSYGLYSIAFSPDGRYLVFGGPDGLLNLWSAHGGERALVLRGHAKAVRGLAFSPDGRWLYTASDDGTVRGWDLARPEMAGDFGLCAGEVFGLQGRPLEARVEGDGDRARVLVRESGADRDLVAIAPRQEESQEDLARTQDGQRRLRPVRVKDTDQGGVGSGQILDVATGEVVATLVGHSSTIQAAAFSPDGTRVATASVKDARVKLWDVATGQELLSMPHPEPDHDGRGGYAPPRLARKMYRAVERRASRTI